MKWVWTKFDGYVKPHCCHPLYHKTRMAYLFETYHVRPTETKKVTDMQVDFGGMLCTTDPHSEIQLKGERVLSFWNHQASLVRRTLLRAKEIKYGRYTFYKFSRFPGVLCIISKTDRQIAVRELEKMIDLEAEAEHNAQMHEHLVQANARGDKSKEKAVRKMLDQFQGGESPNN